MTDWSIPAKSAPYHAGHVMAARRQMRLRSQTQRVPPGGVPHRSAPRGLGDPNDQAVQAGAARAPHEGTADSARLAPPSILQMKIMTMLREEASTLTTGPFTDTVALVGAGVAKISPTPPQTAPIPSAARAPDGQSAYDLPVLRAETALRDPRMDLRHSG